MSSVKHRAKRGGWKYLGWNLVLATSSVIGCLFSYALLLPVPDRLQGSWPPTWWHLFEANVCFDVAMASALIAFFLCAWAIGSGLRAVGALLLFLEALAFLVVFFPSDLKEAQTLVPKRWRPPSGMVVESRQASTLNFR
jgi:hypothetical protein